MNLDATYIYVQRQEPFTILFAKVSPIETLKCKKSSVF